jgi:transposase
MRFYTQQHRFYAGIDLHARTLHLCILEHDGEVVFDRNLACRPDVLLHALAPFRDGLVIGVECMFAWYWVADLCVTHDIAFVLGHALYMKAIHGGKAKNDRIDATKLARLLRGGNFPIAYAYPKGMRETRDLLRRRTYLVRKRAELLTHLQTLNAQYNLAPFPKKLSFPANRDEMKIAEQFSDPSVHKSAAADLAVIERLDEVIGELELYLTRTAKTDRVQTYHRLQTIPGVGKLLALILLYEMHEAQRFHSAGQFLSYARLVRCAHESAGKKLGSGGKKIGNAHLAGPSRKRPACFCAAANEPRNGSGSWRPSAATARPWRSWRRGWRARSTTCSARARPRARNASGRAAHVPRRVPLPCPATRRSMPAIDFRHARRELRLAEVLDLLDFEPSVRHRSRPRSFGLAPGAARLDRPENRTKRLCPAAALASS